MTITQHQIFLDIPRHCDGTEPRHVTAIQLAEALENLRGNAAPDMDLRQEGKLS